MSTTYTPKGKKKHFSKLLTNLPDGMELQKRQTKLDVDFVPIKKDETFTNAFSYVLKDNNNQYLHLSFHPNGDFLDATEYGDNHAYAGLDYLGMHKDARAVKRLCSAKGQLKIHNLVDEMIDKLNLGEKRKGLTFRMILNAR